MTEYAVNLWQDSLKSATVCPNSPLLEVIVTKTVDLDGFDRALLREVQNDNQIPARVLADRVGLSQSAVLRRLRRLRKEKVIVADVSIVSPDILGKPLAVHVLVSINQGSRTYNDFARKLRSRPEVRHASYVTGGADFVVHLQLASMDEYAAFAKEVFHDDVNVAQFYTYVAMKEVVGPNSTDK